MLDLNAEKVRLELITTLGKLRYRPAVPELTRVFEQAKANDHARPLALSALADIADPASQPMFLGLKSDKDASIRLYANEGLARLADKSLETVMSADRLVEKNVRVQTAQAFGLLRMGREEYLDELVRSLGRSTTKDLAREYLLETPEAVRPALFGATSKSAAVRAELADVLGLMKDRVSAASASGTEARYARRRGAERRAGGSDGSQRERQRGTQFVSLSQPCQTEAHGNPAGPDSRDGPSVESTARRGRAARKTLRAPAYRRR